MIRIPARSVCSRALVAGAAALALLAPNLALAEPQAAPAASPVTSIGTYAAKGTGPGLWVIKDEDSTLYLFGTFHALKPDTAWRTTAMDKAFASADEYWFEVADLTDVSEAQPVIMQKGLSLTRPLSGLLTPEERASLDEAAKAVGLTAAQLDPMKPWFASLTLAVATITKAGYQAQNGGDQILHAMAEETGKPIKGLETMVQQINFLADMDDASQLEALRSGLKDFERGEIQLNAMVSAWTVGDMDGLDRMIGETTRVEAPEMYETLFTRRNKNWADQVEQMLAGSGTVFIAVGAGHLAGPDSLQAQLEQRGIRAERILN